MRRVYRHPIVRRVIVASAEFPDSMLGPFFSQLSHCRDRDRYHALARLHSL